MLPGLLQIPRLSPLLASGGIESKTGTHPDLTGALFLTSITIILNDRSHSLHFADEETKVPQD